MTDASKAAAADDLPLTIGISTRALFDLEEEHRVFESDGVDAYVRLQLEREDMVLPKGTAFDVVDRLLALNPGQGTPLVRVILLSRNSPDLSLRAFRSAEHYKLRIERGSFTNGRPVAPYIPAWNMDLFLSNHDEDVRQAVEAGTAAARLGGPAVERGDVPGDEVRFALDGDAVVFDAESDNLYAARGLEAFLAHERENAAVPMKRGPFGKFLHKLALLRQRTLRADGSSRVRIALVTARNAPAHERVVQTLRAWGTPADEAHFVGTHSKAPILRAVGAHIFFDDQEKHVLGAAGVTAAGLVPGPHAAARPVIPAAD